MLSGQGRMVTQFHQFAIANDRDAIGIADGGEAMSDDDGGAALAESTQGALYAAFGLYVDGGGGFIEHQHGRIGHVRARQADQLALPMAQVRAERAHVGVITVSQTLQCFVRTEIAGSGDQLLVAGVGCGQAQIVEDAAAEQNVVLQHHADMTAQAGLGQLAHVVPVQGDGPFDDVVEASQQLHQCTFCRVPWDRRWPAPRRRGCAGRDD